MKLTMRLGVRSYDIIIKQGGLSRVGQLINLNRRVLVVSDTGVPEAYLKTVLAQCREGVPVVLPQGEGTLISGSAANGSNRWGDYANLVVDPADDCTFWFTTEYSPSSSWATRIGTVKFDACGTPPTPDFSLACSPASCIRRARWAPRQRCGPPPKPQCRCSFPSMTSSSVDVSSLPSRLMAAMHNRTGVPGGSVIPPTSA